MAKARIHTRVEDSTLRASKLLATHMGITYGEVIERGLNSYVVDWCSKHLTGTNEDSRIARHILDTFYSPEE